MMVVENIVIDISTVIFNDNVENYRARYVKMSLLMVMRKTTIVISDSDMFEIVIVNDGMFVS